jgi:hypothetical protein
MAQIMDFVHDDSGSHRLTGRAPKSVLADDEDDELFASDPAEPDEDEDEDGGVPLDGNEAEEESEPEPEDEGVEPEAEPEPKASRRARGDPNVERLVQEAHQQREQFNRLQAEMFHERLQKAQAELSAVKSHGALLARDYEQAKREYQEAVELGETAKLGDLNEKLNDLRHNMRQIADYTRNREQQLSNPQQQQAPPPPAPKPNPLAMEWAKRNKWFGDVSRPRTVALTGAAYALDKILIEEGFNPHSRQFYKELDKRLRESMNAGARRQRQTVAAVGSRPAPGARASKVRLTGRQKAMAAKLGVPEADYAKYVDM